MRALRQQALGLAVNASASEDEGIAEERNPPPRPHPVHAPPSPTHAAGNGQAASSKYEHGIGEGFSTSGGVELAEAAARLFQQAIFEARTMSRMRRLAASL